ncbi:MAG: ComEC/Rec2 family competence protein [Puniceicoccales bacterium]|nr:ComEC/Rec2 family competence protein [Puniceicoccales bacterium]
MESVSQENNKFLSPGIASPLFLPILFFIAGIQLRRSFPAMQISAVLLLALFFLWLLRYFPIPRIGSSPGKIFPMGMLIIFLGSMFCGALYYQCRCTSGSRCKNGSWSGEVTLSLVAKTLTVIDENHGIFSGYGTVKQIVNVKRSKHLSELAGARIFFNVENANEIPVCGQKFTLCGKLKFVSDSSKWWFWKHLKKSHVNWHISKCCLVSCDEKAGWMEVFCGKIFTRISHSLIIGVESKKIEAGILAGMLTGIKQKMDPAAKKLFNDLGIAHLFAVSGIHVGIIAATIDFFLRVLCLRKQIRALPTLFLLMFYVNAIGCSPSSMRALTMVAFYYLSTLFGRRPNVLAALANSAWLHVLWDPFVVFNISFLLSYSVVAGIILLGFPLKNYLLRVLVNLHGLKWESYPFGDRLVLKIKRSLIVSFSISFSAYLISLPLSVEYFGTISLITIPINMFLVPVATCAIVVGAVVLFCGLCKWWMLCAIGNKIACFFIYIFYLLARSLYCRALCFGNIKIPQGIGNALTLVILMVAYVAIVGLRDSNEITSPL